MTNPPTEWRPVAHVAVQDSASRAAIVETLRGRGWTVVEQPTSLHLIHAISGAILGDQPWLHPGLIVVDAMGYGCSGVTIARGVRDLDLHIPVIVVGSPKDKLPVTSDETINIVEPENVVGAVELVAGHLQHGPPRHVKMISRSPGRQQARGVLVA